MSSLLRKLLIKKLPKGFNEELEECVCSIETEMKHTKDRYNSVRLRESLDKLSKLLYLS